MKTTSGPSFEELVEARIGFGSYQKILIFLMSFVIMADGIEISALSIILPILKNEWNISENLQGLMGSILFIGLFIGSVLNGFLADIIGRKRSLTYISLIQFFLSLYSSFVHNETIFIVVRGAFGILLGFVVPLVPALTAEWTPLEKRGRVLVVVVSVFSVGQVIAVVIAYYCLDNLGSGNWRLMLLICSFPSLLVWVGCVAFLRDSPRYVMLDQSIEAGMEILNYVIRFNNSSKTNIFTKEKDMKDFEQWKDFMKNEFFSEKTEKGAYIFRKICEIFAPKYWKITIGLWISWFGVNFASYGLVFILPFFLDALDQESIMAHGSQHGLLIMLLTTLCEASSGILAYLVIDLPRLGRKNSLASSQFISSVCLLIAFAITIQDSFIVICILSVARFFGKITFTFIYPLTAEIYPTTCRTMGLGSAAAFGRLSACVMPFLLIKLFYINIYYPFLTTCAISLAGLIGTFIIPHDTRGRFLDERENDFETEIEMENREGLLIKD